MRKWRHHLNGGIVLDILRSFPIPDDQRSVFVPAEAVDLSRHLQAKVKDRQLCPEDLPLRCNKVIVELQPLMEFRRGGPLDCRTIQEHLTVVMEQCSPVSLHPTIVLPSLSNLFGFHHFSVRPEVVVLLQRPRIARLHLRNHELRVELAGVLMDQASN